MAALQPITVMKIALQQQAAQHPSTTLTVPEDSGKGVLIGHADSPTIVAIKVNALCHFAPGHREEDCASATVTCLPEVCMEAVVG